MGWLVVGLVIRGVAVVGVIAGAVLLVAWCVSEARGAAPEACSKATGVHAGEPAPCTGVAFPEGLARRLARCLAADLPECESVLRSERGYRDADRLRFESALRASEIRGTEYHELARRNAGLLPAEEPWYRTTTFAVVVSVVVTGLVVGGAVALLYETGAVAP
jgi:hypothetical protein